MKAGVVLYPGSNCDHDTYRALAELSGVETRMVWHQETDLEEDRFDCLVLPGGFSFGDYLRTGAIARFSPVMEAIERHVAAGGLVLGICNGFQILAEAAMLPGALLPNAGLKFRCQDVWLRVERTDTPFTCACEEGQVLRWHIAHYEGNYFADERTLDELERQGRVVLRYCGPDGELEPRYNPNGSQRHIAGVSSLDRRVLGFMPHPERCMEPHLGATDGVWLFRSLRRWFEEGGVGVEVEAGPGAEAAEGAEVAEEAEAEAPAEEARAPTP